jgi:hypothetical protein
MNGAPRIAPVATSSESSPPFTTAVMDDRLGQGGGDGREQTADRPLPELELHASHSIAFVNRSAPASTTAKLTGSNTTVLTHESFRAPGPLTAGEQRGGLGAAADRVGVR